MLAFASYQGVPRGGYSFPRRSRISCWRMGILSITREISRTSQGKGLRSFTPPSLPIRTIMNPRGRSSFRRALSWVGSVSVKITTSRSDNAAISSSSSSICWINRGSAGLSAKTIIGRLSQRKSLIAASSATKREGSWVPSSPDWAKDVLPKSADETMARPVRSKAFMLANIGGFAAIAMGMPQIAFNFFTAGRTAQRMVI